MFGTHINLFYIQQVFVHQTREGAYGNSNHHENAATQASALTGNVVEAIWGRIHDVVTIASVRADRSMPSFRARGRDMWPPVWADALPTTTNP